MTRNEQQGFTLIELLLAMAFLSSILLLTSLVLVQSMNIFNKGVTVKQLSQVNRTLTEDITRVGNSGTSPTIAWKPSESNKAAACLTIGSSVYLWNIGDTTSDSGYKGVSGPYYRYDAADGSPVNFIKYNHTECPPAADNGVIDSNNATTLVGDQVRVYALDSVSVTNTSLQTLVLTLGSYSGKNSPYNPSFVDGLYQCATDGIGSFCAAATIDTVLYLAGVANN